MQRASKRNIRHRRLVVCLFKYSLNRRENMVYVEFRKVLNVKTNYTLHTVRYTLQNYTVIHALHSKLHTLKDSKLQAVD